HAPCGTAAGAGASARRPHLGTARKPWAWCGRPDRLATDAADRRLSVHTAIGVGAARASTVGLAHPRSIPVDAGLRAYALAATLELLPRCIVILVLGAHPRRAFRAQRQR